MFEATGKRLALAMLAMTAGVSCEEHKASTETPREDASPAADKYLAADPKLEKALKAAAASSAGDQSGPPQGGVFGAGVADQRHPRGAPTKVDVISTGSEPLVLLAPGVDAGEQAITSAYGPAGLELLMQTGPRTALPVVDATLVLGPVPKKEQDTGSWLVADLKRAAPAKEQLATLPAESEADVRSLQGTQVRLTLTPDGRVGEVRTQLGSATKPAIQQMASVVGEALALATVPMPDKAVGVGAQWIAESRMPVGQVDTVAYRAYRLKSVDGDRVELTVKLSAYATSAEVPLPGVPAGAQMVQFEARGEGEVEASRGQPLARKLRIEEQVVMVFQAAGAAGAAAAPTPDPAQGPGGAGAGMLTAQLRTQMAFAHEARGAGGASAGGKP